MDYTILIVDDDEPIHVLAQNHFGGEFNLIHARDAQEAIDNLSETPVNLVLADIHMPGMSGLDFLESLMKDAEKKDIPVLVMTHLPTAEKEKRALELGAADFIEKTLFTEDVENIRERIRMKLITSLKDPDLPNELKNAQKKLSSGLMSEAISGDFISTAKKLCTELKNNFRVDHVSFWTISDAEPSLISTAGIQLPADYGADELKNEGPFRNLLLDKKPYLANHVFSKEEGIAVEFSRENELPAELGVPLYSLNEIKLLRNNMEIPDDVDPFACLILKRNKLFSSHEFNIISGLLTRTGSILWRLYKAL